jgi:FkbM family methyltransferase
VIAIEPNPAMLRLLAINMGINWSMAPIRVIAGAVADAAGSCRLHVPPNRAANATLVAPARARDALADASDTVEVEVRTLDDVLREEPRVDLLKVDVEGFEPAVFRGAAATLARPEVRIVFEWAQGQMRSAGFDPAEVLAILRGHGFRLFDAERYLATRGAAELSDAAIMALFYCNLLALRE